MSRKSTACRRSRCSPSGSRPGSGSSCCTSSCPRSTSSFSRKRRIAEGAASLFETTGVASPAMARRTATVVLVATFAFAIAVHAGAEDRPRIRDFGVKPGVLAPGPENAITDVSGVRVGHRTIVEGDSIRTGVTAVVPHAGNLFQQKVPAAVHVGNGFGKAAGFLQVEELGN